MPLESFGDIAKDDRMLRETVTLKRRSSFRLFIVEFVVVVVDDFWTRGVNMFWFICATRFPIFSF